MEEDDKRFERALKEARKLYNDSKKMATCYDPIGYALYYAWVSWRDERVDNERKRHNNMP